MDKDQYSRFFEFIESLDIDAEIVGRSLMDVVARYSQAVSRPVSIDTLVILLRTECGLVLAPRNTENGVVHIFVRE